MVPISGIGPRRLDGWIRHFVEATSHFPSPPILRQWAGIAAVAGALERRTWIRTAGNDLYPNLYTILVAPPGIGKTVMLTQVERLWRSVRELHVAPTSVTKAALIDSLADARRTVVSLGPVNKEVLDFNSLQVVSGELAVLIPAWDNEFMAALTDFWDCKFYEEKRRTTKLHIRIERPQLNLVGATTPSYLNSLMPEGAWDQGFISRTILIFSGERNLIDPFENSTHNDALLNDLVADFAIIASLQGKMRWEPEAATLLRDWHLAGGPPVPEHSKLANYNTRRTTHALKLCMVASASRDNDLVIKEQDVGVALDWLFEAEKHVPKIFASQQIGGDASVMEEAAGFLVEEFSRTNQPVPEHKLVNFLKSRTPSQMIFKIIDVMIRSKAVEATAPEGKAIFYRPLDRNKA
jgi:hypothetical protein